MLTAGAIPVNLNHETSKLKYKLMDDFYKYKKENTVQEDYGWQIKHLSERIEKLEFVLDKICDLLEEKTK